MKQQGKQVVWPANLDSSKSRRHGRKLAKAVSVQAPRLEEIEDAAKRLSLEAEIVPAKSRPSTWWEKGGYAILDKGDARSALLRSLAGEVKKSRAAKAGQDRERKP